MSEGSDEYVDATEAISMPDHDMNEDVIRWIRDGLYRLHERGYRRDEDDVTIYIGEAVYYELNGDYFDIREEVDLTLEGSPVEHWPTLPDYRVMLIDSNAMLDVDYSTAPTVMHEADASDPTDFELTPTRVQGQQVERPDAIEFVPETEVFLKDG